MDGLKKQKLFDKDTIVEVKKIVNSKILDKIEIIYL